MSCLFFFFNDTATTEIYTLSLHDALPILFGHGPLGCLLGMLAAARQARVVMVGKAGWRFERLRRLEFARWVDASVGNVVEVLRAANGGRGAGVVVGATGPAGGGGEGVGGVGGRGRGVFL